MEKNKERREPFEHPDEPESFRKEDDFIIYACFLALFLVCVFAPAKAESINEMLRRTNPDFFNDFHKDGRTTPPPRTEVPIYSPRGLQGFAVDGGNGVIMILPSTNSSGGAIYQGGGIYEGN